MATKELLTEAAKTLNAIIAENYNGVAKPLVSLSGLTAPQMSRLRSEDISFSPDHIRALSNAMEVGERNVFLAAVVTDLVGKEAAGTLIRPSILA